MICYARLKAKAICKTWMMESRAKNNSPNLRTWFLDVKQTLAVAC